MSWDETANFNSSDPNKTSEITDRQYFFKVSSTQFEITIIWLFIIVSCHHVAIPMDNELGALIFANKVF